MEQSTKKIQENFFYEDLFCSDIESLMEHLELEEEDLPFLPDDWAVKIMDTNCEPMFQLTKEFIIDAILERTDAWEERFPEDSERINKDLNKAIESGVDVDKMNSLIPALYYPADNEYTITKSDLIEWCSPSQIDSLKQTS